ncbi:MAG: PcfJ domain-containing protein [Anaeromyxobacteraceae bacterium]
MQLAIPVPLRHDETGLQVSRLARDAWTRLTFTLDGRSVDVHWSVSGASAEVRVESREPKQDGAQSIRLSIRHRPVFLATVHTDAQTPVHWGMHAPSRRDLHDFFSYAARWAAPPLAGSRTRFPAFLRTLEERLLLHLREPAAVVLSGCNPAVLAAARRLPPALRVRVHGALSRDERGWARQSLSAGPGPILFALALMDLDETVSAGVKLLHDLGEGRRLDAALDEAIGAWADALRVWGRNVGSWSDDQVRAFHVAAAKRGEERARMVANQRVLIRRAGARVDPMLVLVPPPIRFAPEDIPTAPGANAAWYRVMKVPRVTVEAVGLRHPQPFLEHFCAFASRHAPALARPPRGVPLDQWLEWLCETLRTSERTPSRRTDPVRLRESVDLKAMRARPVEARLLYPWDLQPPAPPPAPEPPPVPVVAPPRRRAARRARPLPQEAPPAPPRERLQAVTGGLRREAVLGAPPEHVISKLRFAPWKGANAEVRQLTTLRELRTEGRAMSNCVASYRESVEAGEQVILHASVDGQPLTIAVDRDAANGWYVSEFKGFANRRAVPSEWAALRPFFEGLQD